MTMDKCCRAHDLCPVKVRGYSARYNLTNESLYTKWVFIQNSLFGVTFGIFVIYDSLCNKVRKEIVFEMVLNPWNQFDKQIKVPIEFFYPIQNRHIKPSPVIPPNIREWISILKLCLVCVYEIITDKYLIFICVLTGPIAVAMMNY